MKLHLYTPPDLRRLINKYTKILPDSSPAPPLITIHDNVTEDVISLILPIPKITIKFGRTFFFISDDYTDSDTIAVNVESEELPAIYQRVHSCFKSSFKSHTPYLPIATVPKGTAIFNIRNILLHQQYTTSIVGLDDMIVTNQGVIKCQITPYKGL